MGKTFQPPRTEVSEDLDEKKKKKNTPELHDGSNK